MNIKKYQSVQNESTSIDNTLILISHEEMITSHGYFIPA